MQRLILRTLYCGFVKWFLKLIVGVRFDDASFLARQKQFIIVANHNSHLDTMTIMASLPGNIIHKVKPVAAADYFGRTKLQERLSKYFINALLIRRKRSKNNADEDPIQAMLQALDNGYSLILFPEGTRGEPEKLQKLKPGIGIILSQRPDIPYVPAFMKGMGKIMPKGDNLIVPHNSSLRYGEAKKVLSRQVSSIVNEVEEAMMKLKDDST